MGDRNHDIPHLKTHLSIIVTPLRCDTSSKQFPIKLTTRVKKTVQTQNNTKKPQDRTIGSAKN